MNETILNETNLVARQWFDYEDRNISDFMMYMWTNFAKYEYVWILAFDVVIIHSVLMNACKKQYFE